MPEGPVELNEQRQLCLRRTSDAQNLTVYLETSILLVPVAYMPHWTEKCSSHAYKASVLCVCGELCGVCMCVCVVKVCMCTHLNMWRPEVNVVPSDALHLI